MERHSIKAVAAMTGLSPHLIRIWERRYQAVVPQRTESNRRFYSDIDVERLRLLKRATDAGESIGLIAQMSNDDLRKLVGIAPSNQQRMSQPPPEISGLSAEEHLNRCLEAVEAFDAGLLEQRLTEASLSLGQQVMLEKVIEPFLVEVGERWWRGEWKIAQEHLASAVARTMLGSMYSFTRQEKDAPIIVTTTPSGQLHEFGALMAAITAAMAGWQVTYLGPNLPAQDIAASALKSGARAIALSLVYPPDDPRLAMELRQLRKLVGDDMMIIAGGGAAANFKPELEEIGAVVSADLGDLRSTLGHLRNSRNQESGRRS